ncbi:hypothetical protein ACR02G_004707, partial [Escherichia coli]
IGTTVSDREGFLVEATLCFDCTHQLYQYPLTKFERNLYFLFTLLNVVWAGSLASLRQVATTSRGCMWL